MGERQVQVPPIPIQRLQYIVEQAWGGTSPDSQEREVCLGFPVGYTKNCVPKQEQRGSNYEDQRLTLLGNSWSVGVVAWLISQLVGPSGLGRIAGVQRIVDELTPGRSASFASMLMRRTWLTNF